MSSKVLWSTEELVGVRAVPGSGTQTYAFAPQGTQDVLVRAKVPHLTEIVLLEPKGGKQLPGLFLRNERKPLSLVGLDDQDGEISRETFPGCIPVSFQPHYSETHHAIVLVTTRPMEVAGFDAKGQPVQGPANA